MKPTLEEIRAGIIEVLVDMVEELDLEPDEDVGPMTTINADLGLSSVDVLHLLASIDMRFRIRLPYERMLMCDGEYVPDLTVAAIAGFVHEHFEENFAYPKQM